MSACGVVGVVRLGAAAECLRPAACGLSGRAGSGLLEGPVLSGARTRIRRFGLRA